jgi:hypothetical protein
MSSKKWRKARDSTLPGDPGAAKTPRWNKVKALVINPVIDLDVQADSLWHGKVVDEKQKKKQEAWFATRTERELYEREKARAEETLCRKKALEAHELNMQEAISGYEVLRSEIVDATLLLVFEMHKPTSTSWGWGNNLMLACETCITTWPCTNHTVMSDSLIRRRATDPFLADSDGVNTLMEGAL